jgi:hypothetical protein
VEAELKLAFRNRGDVGRQLGLTGQLEIGEHLLDQAARILVVENIFSVATPREDASEGD